MARPKKRPAAKTKPQPPPRSAPRPLRAKLFRNGGSQAVRLPKECRLPGKEVAVTIDGSRVILEPVNENGWPESFIETFFRGPPDPARFPDRPPQGEDEEREAF